MRSAAAAPMRPYGICSPMSPGVQRDLHIEPLFAQADKFYVMAVSMNGQQGVPTLDAAMAQAHDEIDIIERLSNRIVSGSGRRGLESRRQPPGGALLNEHWLDRHAAFEDDPGLRRSRTVGSVAPERSAMPQKPEMLARRTRTGRGRTSEPGIVRRYDDLLSVDVCSMRGDHRLLGRSLGVLLAAARFVGMTRCQHCDRDVGEQDQCDSAKRRSGSSK